MLRTAQNLLAFLIMSEAANGLYQPFLMMKRTQFTVTHYIITCTVISLACPLTCDLSNATPKHPHATISQAFAASLPPATPMTHDTYHLDYGPYTFNIGTLIHYCYIVMYHTAHHTLVHIIIQLIQWGTKLFQCCKDLDCIAYNS